MTLLNFLGIKTKRMPSNPYNRFIDSIPMAAALTTYDANDPKIIVANKAHQKLTGYTNAELIGMSPRMFKGPLTDTHHSAELKKAIKENDFFSGKLINYTKAGKPYDMMLTVVGVVIEGRKFYCGLKRPV